MDEKSVERLAELVDSFREESRKELRALRSYIACQALLTFFGVAAILFEIGRLIG